MNSFPFWIVILWFLPLVLNIIIPIVLFSGALLVRGPAFLLRRSGSQTQSNYIEKRGDRRINSNDLDVNVSDGVGLFKGVACNISRMGICIMGLPRKIRAETDHLAIVVDNHGESYSLKVVPRWEKSLNSGRQIGAAIEYAPEGWHGFVRESTQFV